MKTIHAMTAAVAMMAVANVWGDEFSAKEKNAIRSVAEKCASEMAKADFKTAFKNAGVWFLPVVGDKDSFCHDLIDAKLIDAGRPIGLSNVLPLDTNNVEFVRLLRVMERHDLDREAMGALEPDKLNRWGFMRPVNIVLIGKLKLDRNSPRRSTSLLLSAINVETKQKVWTREMVAEPVAMTTPTVAPFKASNDALNVVVSVFQADNDSAALATKIGSAVRSKVAALGYAVDGARETNVLLTVMVTRVPFDALGEYRVFDGRVALSAELRGADTRTLAETTIEEHGARGLGVIAAERKVADKLIPNIDAWLAKSLNVDVLGLASETFTLAFSEKAKTSEEIAVCERFRKAMEKLDGVHSASVIASDPQKGVATFRVIYDKRKIRSSVRAVLFEQNQNLGNELAE